MLNRDRAPSVSFLRISLVSARIQRDAAHACTERYAVVKKLLPILVLPIWLLIHRERLVPLLLVGGLFAISILVFYGGDVAGNYLGFAFPFLVSVAVSCILLLKNPMWVCFLGTLLVFNAFMPDVVEPLATPYTSRVSAALGMPQAAEQLDRLMDSCKMNRYFMAEDFKPLVFAFTKHSPYQISYGIKRASGGLGYAASISEPNPYFAALYAQDLKKAQIVVAMPDDDPNARQDVMKTGKILAMDTPDRAHSNLSATLVSVLKSEFTTDAPACARKYLPIRGLKLFFRER